MINNNAKILDFCIKNAKAGNFETDVFDMMYETGLKYPDLKAILDGLISEGELLQCGARTYKFTGDINRVIEPLQPQPKKSTDGSPASDERMSYIERRRRELLDRLRDDGEETDEEDDGRVEKTVKFLKAEYVKAGKREVPETYWQALECCIKKGKASPSIIQRNIPVGYLLSRIIFDWLEEMEFVSHPDGHPESRVLVSTNLADNYREDEEENEDKAEEEQKEEAEEPDGGPKKFSDTLKQFFEKVNVADGANEARKVENALESREQKIASLTDVLKKISAVKNAEETRYQSGLDAEEFVAFLREKFNWRRVGNYIFIRVDGLKFKNGRSVEFRLIKYDNVTILTDNRIAMHGLTDKIGSTRAKNKIERFIKNKEFKFQNYEVRINTSPSSALSDYMSLYLAVENLL